MKTTTIVLALISLGVNTLSAQVAQTKPAVEPAADGSTRYEEVERGPHHRVVATVRWETNELGTVTASTNSYTELATGLHYREGEQWLASEAKIEILPNNAGAAASKGQHRAIFPPEIKSGIIELQTPDNQWMRSRVWGLAYFDGTTGESVLIAEVKESTGQVVGDNVVIYQDAFTDCRADIRYTYTLAGFEQDVVFREQPPAPEKFGMIPKNARLQVLTEFVEAPAPTKESRQVGELVDQSLGFGAMSIGSGKAFSVDAIGDTTGDVPVAKEWTPLEGRAFLIEEVYYEKVADQLQKLPAAGEYKGASLERRGTGENVIAGLKKIMPKRYAKTTPKPGTKRMAQARPSSAPGFVMDYVTLNNQADFTFAGNTNYYVSGTVNLTGITTIEGGTVVKFGISTAAQININDPQLICQTAAYRPAIFTAKDDNTVGETISGSTGNPSLIYGYGGGLYYGGYDPWGGQNNPVLANLRFSYLRTALSLGWDEGQSFTLANVQMVHCETAIYLVGAMKLRNCLFYDIGSVFTSSESETAWYGEHLTINQCDYFANAHKPELHLTNSLLVDVNLEGPLVTVAFWFTEQTPVLSGPGIFQTVGAASHYLATDSPYRNVGTPNITTTLANDLKNRTTYPPQTVTANITSPTVWTPVATRDIDQPDLGYHYDPLDYVANAKTVSANLTLTGGVALGTYGVLYSYGLGLNSGNFISEGTPAQMNWIVRYNTVQEQSTTTWSASTAGTSVQRSSIAATVDVRFTGWSLLSAPGIHFYDDTGGATPSPSSFSNCQFGGGKFTVDTGSITLKNCLWERVWVFLRDRDYNPQWSLYNNLFYGGTFEYRATEYPVLLAYDNLFDKTTIKKGNQSAYFSHGNNGYASTTHLGGTSSGGDKDITWPADYQPGPLGRYYYPSTVSGQNLATLINAGSRTAAAAGLYHHTTQTSQTKELCTQVDIGFHYVSLDSSGNAHDSNLDGIPDYLEDKDGDGVVDAGETPWGPTVTVQSNDQNAAEDYGTGSFTITRTTENLAVPLTVNFQIAGTATEGVDYLPFGTKVTIPATQESVDLVVRPLRDCITDEGNETVTLTTVCGDNYLVGTPNGPTVTIQDGPCDNCTTPFLTSWKFTDDGFILGGQEGAPRTYYDPASVPASPWSYQPAPANQVSLRMSFEDDYLCGGLNGNTQKGTAEAFVYSSCPSRLFVNWSGMGEQQDPSLSNMTDFERMTLFVDGSKVGGAHSPGGGLGCDAPMAPVVSDPAPPQFIDLDPGLHSIRIETTTVDWRYHIGAYYQFVLAFLPPPPTVPPTITTQPLSQDVNVGANVSFTVVATGTLPLTYQWRFNGVNMIGADSPTLTLNSVQLANAGAYSVVVQNIAGSATSSSANLTVNSAVVITTQPQSQTVNVAANVTFTVAATGTGLQYQWHFNGQDISGATSTTLVRNGVQLADAGTYSVRVANAAGYFAISSDALLTVENLVAPTITVQPVPRSAIIGSDVTLAVSASGAVPKTYSWYRVDVVPAVASGPNPVLTLNNVQSANAGYYYVVVQNSYGSATSDTVPLTVTTVPLPPVVITPASSAALPATVTLSVPGYTGTTIYYTLDGSIPTTSSFQYSTPLPQTTKTTITAFATKPNYLNSGLTASIIGDANSPVSNWDWFSVDQESAATTLDVLGNDTDPNGDTLTLSSVTQPPNGTVTLGTTDLSYTPNAGFYGIDTFSYEAIDPSGNASRATVLVFVNKAGNGSPVVADKQQATLAVGNNTAVINARGNTTDPDSGDVVSVYFCDKPMHGAVSIDSGAGAITYLRDNGFMGVDVISYLNVDAQGGVVKGSASIDNLDSDGDNIPDEWEMAGGLNRFWDDSEADPDGDGLPNLVEFLLHCNPQNSDNPLNFSGVSLPTLLQGNISSQLSISPNAEAHLEIALYVDGEVADGVVRKTTSGWFLEWDTTTTGNGQHQLFLKFAPSLKSGHLFNPPVQGGSATVNVQNPLTFGTGERHFTDSLVIDAAVINSASSYSVEIYDDNTSSQLKTLSGTVVNNRISTSWDLLEGGARIANGPLRCEFQLYSALGIPLLVQPLKIIYALIDKINRTKFTVAWGLDEYEPPYVIDPPTPIPETPKGRAMRLAMLRGVVNNLDTLVDYHGSGTDYNLLPSGIGNVNAPYVSAFHWVTTADGITLKNSLPNGANLYWWGHGFLNDSLNKGPSIGVTGDYLYSSDVANILKNYLGNKHAKTPYRLVILDCCFGYQREWANAFGIPFSKRGLNRTQLVMIGEGQELQSFVGWPCEIQYPPTPGAINQLEGCQAVLFAEWQAGLDLKKCISNYANNLINSVNLNTDFNFNGISDFNEWKISGCSDLTTYNR